LNCQAFSNIWPQKKTLMALERKRKDFLTQREWHCQVTDTLIKGEISGFSNNYFQFLHWKFSTQKRTVWKLWSLDSVHFLQTYVLNMFSNLYFSKRYRERQEQHQKIHRRRIPALHFSFKHVASCKGKPPQVWGNWKQYILEKTTFSCL